MPIAIYKNSSGNSRLIDSVSGVILAGGISSRMGSNKALLPYKEGRFIEAIYHKLSHIFKEVILVTNSPEQYNFIPCQKVQDIHKGIGVLAGIHSGLHHSSNESIFAVACDMPYLVEDLIRYLASAANSGGVLIPESEHGLEPLHAVYGKGCLAAIESTLLCGERRIVSFFNRVTVNKVNIEQVRYFDPSFTSFININTPEEYFKMRSDEKELKNIASIQSPNARNLGLYDRFQDFIFSETKSAIV